MEIALVLAILVAAVALFASEKLPIDLVALLVLAMLLLSGLITAEEGISGFSNPATITVLAMFVLSAGIQKTGAVAALGRLLIRGDKYAFGLLAIVMFTVAVVSAFVNNTAAVAVFLPLVLAAAAHRKIPASKLLIPLSFASQFGGVCTLMGTSTNLLVSSISDNHGYGAFSIFEFSRLGIIMVAAGLAYFLLIGRALLPVRRGEELTDVYQLGDYITELRVMPDSPLIGKAIHESSLQKEHDITLIKLLRKDREMWAPANEPLREGDVLLVEGNVKNILTLKDGQKLEIEPEFQLKDNTLQAKDLRLVEAVVAPRSRLVGRTLSSLDFARRFRLIVLAIQRRERALREKLDSVHLRFGDSLLVQGPSDEIAKLQRNDNFILLAPLELPSLRRRKVPVALVIVSLVVGLAAFGIMPIVASAIVGAVAMVLTGCLRMDEAYDAVDWRVVVLLGGILPLGTAMEKSGVAELIAHRGIGLVSDFGPVAVLAALYLVTAVLTEAMTNNASVVLMAPIAISSAVTLGVDPKPFLLAVTFAASTSFATPVGYQTNTMVYTAGGYRFTDFAKVGVPLNLIFWALAVYFIPKFWPL